MDGHGFMQGMMWAGALLAAIPVSIWIAGGIYLYRHYRERPDQPGGPPAPAAGARAARALPPQSGPYRQEVAS